MTMNANLEIESSGVERRVGASDRGAPGSPATLPPQLDNPQAREAIEWIRKMTAEFIAKLSEP